MNAAKICAAVCLALSLVVMRAEASSPVVDASIDPTAQVTMPLEDYQRLLQQASSLPLSPPSAYAIGQSDLNINFQQAEGRVSATVRAQLSVETYGDDWTLVPILGPGAALATATVDNTAVQLVQRPEGLYWLSDERQQVQLSLTYHVDSHFADRAYVTALPIPKAAATKFRAQIPQTHIDLAVAPATNLLINSGSSATNASGNVPSSSSLMLSWRVAVERPYVLSRAEYTGVVQSAARSSDRDSAIAWHAQISAELMIDGEVSVPLLPASATLLAVDVDGEPATIYTVDEQFALRLAGAGKHQIDLRFLSPVVHPDGVPTTQFPIPNVPVSRFSLRLEGDKQVQVQPQSGPAASVDLRHPDADTVASFYLPMGNHVSLSWMDALPADVDLERRANAVVYQSLSAAEGVMYGQASIRYEITRGEEKVLEFSLPARAQVNQISSPAGAIADWIEVERSADDDPDQRHLRVFLNRAVSGEFILNIAYEQLLADVASGAGQSAEPIPAPILRAVGVSRQKGMIALLSGSELALAPLVHEEMSEVGENELPAFFHNQLQQAVSHTFKYHSAAASLSVQTATPEHEQGKFNAQVDTLISIGEVTLKGQAGIEIDVKSGVLRDLRLIIPSDVNLLGVAGPSIRNHTVETQTDGQSVEIEFTREMDGQFRIELNYERIMLDGTSTTNAPRIAVVGADVAHGRIAIEALSALEVQATQVEQLSTLEINELPRQLVLKTTNPILLAYRYVETEQPFALQLTITRHQEIDVQVAAIDNANYRTLYTADGLAVTRAQFDVRNSRRQFLRLSLPLGSEIWSVFVNGNAQKPAFAADSAEDSIDVLIKMVNSAAAFSVELVYATQGQPMSTFGHILGSLPRPDIIVTRSSWDVYVPTGPRYAAPESNMEIGVAQVLSSMADAPIASPTSAGAGEPLHIELPTQGLGYHFAKLYANQSADDAYFSLRYVNRSASFGGLWLSLLGTLAVWLGIVGLGGSAPSKPRVRTFALMLLVAGAGAIAASISLLSASVMPPSLLSLVIASGLAGWMLWQWWQRRSMRESSPTDTQ